MSIVRASLISAVLGATLAVACSKTTASPAEAPSGSAGKSSLPNCRWEPVKPDTDERCNAANAGTQINVTQRESMRAQDTKTMTLRCVCD
jgi:hypothetical protein